MNSSISKVFLPGDRVLAYDSSLFKDDKSTPCLDLTRPATVVCWYGCPIRKYSDDLILGPYPNLVDVIFDHKPDRVSHGHFGDGVETLETLCDPQLNKRYRPEHLLGMIEKARATL